MFNMKQKLKISFNFVSSLSVVCLISVLHSLWKCFNNCLSKQMEVSGYEAIVNIVKLQLNARMERKSMN